MRIRQLLITEEFAGRSVHDLLKNELLLSESLISRLKRRDTGIMLDGARAYTTRKVVSGERLIAEVGDDPAFPRPEPMEYPLSILYEDEDYVAIDKPAGLTVHASTHSIGECTLENALAAYLPKGENPHPVSRLDRGTTGVMLFSKSGYAHELLRRRAHTADYFREYRAICYGTPDPERGEIALPIGFAENSGYQRAVTEAGAPARTRYEVLCKGGGMSLLRLLPETGRTHQLRVHMAAVGCPLVGDWLYGKEERERIARPALHSYMLVLRHPLTGETHKIIAPLPADFVPLMEFAQIVP